MIDGISFRLLTEQIKGGDVLEFKSNGNRSEAKHKGFRVCSYPDSTHVTGSIHKYFNDGVHNSDDFHLTEFVQALDALASTLNFNPECVPFNTFEFGVNILLPFDVKKFIESLVYTKKGTEKRDGQGASIELGEYYIKIYMKPTPENTNVLRYEIHISRTRSIKKRVEAQGEYCRTLSDLKNPKVWSILGKTLIESYDTFLFMDINSFTDISNEQYKWLCKASRSSYWLSWNNRVSKQREFEKLKKFISERSTNKIFEITRGLITEKVRELIDVKNVTKSPTVENKERPGCVIKSPTVEIAKKAEMLQNPRLDNWGKRNISDINNRVCKVTKLSLDIGIKQGEYLSTKGVEFYYENQPEIYSKILFPRLSEKWKNSDLKIHFREIAHSIRNEVYNPQNNPRNNFKRDIKNLDEPNMSWLFSLAETVKPDKKIFLS